MANNPTNKVNGHVIANSEHLTSNIDYFTVSTGIDLANAVGTNATGEDTVDTALDKLIEIVAQRGQPVILGSIGVSSGVYTLRFATEHKGSWNVTGSQTADNSAADLLASIVLHGVDYGFVAGVPASATGNTSVTVSSSL